MPDHLRPADATKRAQCGHEINRFENVGLALGVVAEQEVESRRKVRIQPLVIAEVAKSQMRQMHARNLSAPHRERRDFSARDGQSGSRSYIGRACGEEPGPSGSGIWRRVERPKQNPNETHQNPGPVRRARRRGGGLQRLRLLLQVQGQAGSGLRHEVLHRLRQDLRHLSDLQREEIIGASPATARGSPLAVVLCAQRGRGGERQYNFSRGFQAQSF